jgi:transposase InsO family protein
MQIHRLSYQVRGFVKITDYAIRYARMVTEKAKHKARVLAFWGRHGLKATEEAFKVKRRTLYYWQSQLVKGEGRLEGLNEGLKRPKSVRKRDWPQEIKDEIKRLRQEHPNLGKDKIHPFLKEFCQKEKLTCPSISTIGNLIKDMGRLRTFPVKVRHNGAIVPRKRAKRARKPKHFIALYPGHCGSFDTIEKVIHGCRRYIITFTDVYSRFSLAWATTSHASKAAKTFFDFTLFLFPFPFTYVLTDNGSEFMKHFDAELKQLHLTHWHTYPKMPKMNPHVERFNRSIQEEHIDYHEPELLEPEQFNKGLMKYLLWYNTKRPHWSLNMKSPVEFIQTNHPQECNMYLTDTMN